MANIITSLGTVDIRDTVTLTGISMKKPWTVEKFKDYFSKMKLEDLVDENLESAGVSADEVEFVGDVETNVFAENAIVIRFLARKKKVNDVKQ